MTLTGCVRTDGSLDLDGGRAAFRDAIQPLRGKRIEIVVREKKRKRSSPANRYWWGCVLKVAAQELGYSDPDDLHDAIVLKFRPLPPDPVTGLLRRQKTSEMDSQQFAAFTDEAIAWLEHDLGIRVPRPHEVEAA